MTAGKVRMLSREQSIAFYDHFGSRQDWQAFYETPATCDLIAHAHFETARSVFEFGCGTGAFAEKVLSHHLPQDAHYVAVDSSSTMIELARSRLARFGGRVEVRLSDGSLQFDGSNTTGSYDRFVSNYVIDLLPPGDIAELFTSAHLLLGPQGLLCLAGLTFGQTLPTRLVSWFWQRVHSIQPRLVGGCRPLEVRDYLAETLWRNDYRNIVAAYGIASEVVVASKLESD